MKSRPAGEPPSANRAVRGGTWYYESPSVVRGATTYSQDPARRSHPFGFRTSLPGKIRR